VTTTKAVKKRTSWAALEPMPSAFNPIYPKRLEAMAKRGGYRADLVGSPIVADNGRLAFEGYEEDALLILDGNHRYRLAESEHRLSDEVLIDLRHDLTRREMFELRIGIDNRRTIKPAEQFIQLREMGDLRKQKITEEVELIGFEITHERQDGGLSCTKELEWIYQRSPAAMSIAVMSYLAIWGLKQFSAQARVIKGLGAFWIRYPDAELDHLVAAARRANLTVQKLYDAGKLEHENLPYLKSVADGIRYVLAGTYNYGRSQSRRLPMP
jgi:hypothetical protein